MEKKYDQLKEKIYALGFAQLHIDNYMCNKGTLSFHNDISHPVFLRFARSPNRFATEYAALQYIFRRLGNRAPIPTLFVAVPQVAQGVLLLSYEEGQDLAAFLPEEVDIPPFLTSSVPLLPPIKSDISKALEEIGQALSMLHTIELPWFGKLVGKDPNPYRSHAQHFTRAETQHALQLCLTSGWIHMDEHAFLNNWIEERLPLISSAETPRLIHYDMHPANIRLCQDLSGQWAFRCFLDFEHARAWVPEYDLAILACYIRTIDKQWWEAFLRGYGRISHERLHLFEIIKALQAMAYTSPHSTQEHWGHWFYKHLKTFLEQSK